MNTTQASVNLYAYGYAEAKTYLLAALFIVGNIALPQLFHLVPKGGMIWLPIYFFTLIGAYKYGWRVGLLTAVLSPLANSALFGMPVPDVLPAIICKSVLLAVGAGYAASRFHRVSMPLLAAVVLFYQLFGSMAELAMTGNPDAALQDVRMALPGMALQIVGGYLFIRNVLRK